MRAVRPRESQCYHEFWALDVGLGSLILAFPHPNPGLLLAEAHAKVQTLKQQTKRKKIKGLRPKAKNQISDASFSVSGWQGLLIYER